MDIILNTNHKKFVCSNLEDSKLIGIAGGGKTTMIIYKIIHHFTTKHFKSKSDFLILTFSKKTKSDFLLKGNKIQKNLFTGDNVRTFYSLAGTIIQKLSEKQCTSLQLTIVSAINAINKSSKNHLTKVKCLKNVKAIIIDDAQDMSNIQYELLLEIKKKLNTCIILIGDPNQNIYQFQNGTDKYLMEFNGTEHFIVENNRSTPEITNFINYFRPWNTKFPNMISTLKSINKKPIVFTGTHNDICMRILNEIKNTKFPFENIAIIGPIKKSGEKSPKFSLQKITNFLNKHNIKFTKHYNDKTHDQEYINDDIAIEKDKINIFTIYGSKGLEFDKVILVNFQFKTFGKTPSQEEYNMFKYLWYVALSRAKCELLICADCNSACYNELQICPLNTYVIEGDEVIFKPLSFDQQNDQYENIVSMLNNKKYFDEKNLSALLSAINITELTSKLYHIYSNIKYESKHQEIIIHFLKYVFEYHYCLFSLNQLNFVTKMETFIENIILINSKHQQALVNILAKSNIDITDIITLSNLEPYKNKFTSSEKKLYEIIKHHVKHDHNKKFSLVVNKDFSSIFNNDVCLDKKAISETCNNIKIGNDVIWNIFKLCLFENQCNNETKYFWNSIEEFKDYLAKLKIYIDKIIMLSAVYALRSPNCKFNIKVTHPNITMFGMIDIIFNDIIVFVEFTDDKNITNCVTKQLMCFLSYHCLHNKWDSKKCVEIWNLKTGVKHKIKFNSQFRNIDVSMFITEVSKKKLKDMVFVYDLETTGLDVKTCEIIERYFHELCHDETYTDGVICPKSIVPQLILDITGISKKELKYGEDVKLFCARMNKIMETCISPLFIAHNGNVFDHQIMRNNNYLDSTCKYLDSRMIIRQLSQNRVKNQTLFETYNIVMGKQFGGKAHRAKADVIMLLDIFEKLHIDEYELLKLA